MMDDMEFYERQEINDIEVEEDTNGFTTFEEVDEDENNNIDDEDTEDEL
jgi:hypothetical protein